MDNGVMKRGVHVRGFRRFRSGRPAAYLFANQGVSSGSGVEAEEWIAPRLLPWGSAEDWPLRVGSIIPIGFPSYARVLHPAVRLSGSTEIPVRWESVANKKGVRLDAQTCWKELDAPDLEVQEPSEGSLTAEQAVTIQAILRRHTSQSEHCWFGIWDGYGNLDAHRRWPNAGRLALPNRDYVLLSRPLEAAALSFGSPPWYQTANLWWPADRSWFVSTEIDYRWTFVGGSEACIAEIVADPRLETFEVTANVRVLRPS